MSSTASTSTATSSSTDTGLAGPAADPPPTAGATSPWPRRLLMALAALALTALVVQLVGPRLRPHLYAGTVLQSPTEAPSLDFLDLTSGEPLDLAAFDGEVVLLYFGYTSCPDICPGTLARATLARASLPAADQDGVTVVMVSVDPARDSPAEAERYVTSFDESFLAATGSPADIDLATTQYGVFHQRSADTGATGGALDGGYTIDHTSSLMGIGPDGHLRVVWAPDVEVELLTADLAALLG